MIKLDIQNVIFIYVSVFLIGLMVLWVFASRGPKLKDVKDKEKASTWKCSICSYDYIDSGNEEISICPLCGSYNKK